MPLTDAGAASQRIFAVNLTEVGFSALRPKAIRSHVVGDKPKYFPGAEELFARIPAGTVDEGAALNRPWVEIYAL
jgi:hypothetical protein